MQVTIPLAATSSPARRAAISCVKVGAFAALLWASATTAVAVPGTPVRITMQTFVLMVAALSLSWREAGACVAIYLAAGAAGLPVFANGASTLALIGPSAGFLFGFLPGVMLTVALRGTTHTTGMRGCALMAMRHMLACVAGCIVLVYAVAK